MRTPGMPALFEALSRSRCAHLRAGRRGLVRGVKGAEGMGAKAGGREVGEESWDGGMDEVLN